VLGTATIILDFEWDFLTFQIPALLFDDGMGGIFTPKGSPSVDEMLRPENFTCELIGLLLLAGALLVAFSKEKREDEYLVHLRLSALIWAVYVNAALTALAFVMLYGFNFLYFMMCNLFAVLLLFIAKYQWKLYTLKNAQGEE
jgi:hypothetical protein